MVILAGGTPGTPPSRMPMPPRAFSRQLAPTWTAIRPAHRGRRQADPVLVGLQLLRHPDDHARFIFERASAMLVCSPISILAIWLRCTSSGPSAKRKVLACAYA